jgi:hypothetical protein
MNYINLCLIANSHLPANQLGFLMVHCRELLVRTFSSALLLATVDSMSTI